MIQEEDEDDEETRSLQQAMGQAPQSSSPGPNESEIETEEKSSDLLIPEANADDEMIVVSPISASEQLSQEFQLSRSDEMSLTGKESEQSSVVTVGQKRANLKVIITKTTSDEASESERTSSSAFPSSENVTEREESLQTVGADISRDDTSAEVEFTSGIPTIETATSEGEAHFKKSAFYVLVEEEEIEDDEETKQRKFERIKLELKFKELFGEHSRFKHLNNQIQNKLANYYKKKAEESKIELKKPQADYDQRYGKFMDVLAKVQDTYNEENDHFQEQIDELSGNCEEQQQLTDYAWRMFQSRKKVVAKNALNKRLGRQAALQELERVQSIEEQKEKEMRQIRFLIIKMKNKLKYYEHQLKAKEELADGLNLIDYEQLKIENQSYSEKIEERIEEVTKMKKKIASTIEVLTHIKEKLEYVEKENEEKKIRLREVEAVVAQKREILTKTKQARDRVRTANHELKEKCGLLCNKLLLRDLEDNVDANERLHHQLEELKRRHTDLTLDSYGIKKKIEWVKMGQAQT
ncbi:coiled-coil domain-containing protein 96 [Amblyraja radiata]|uniref:coiled-coil domain-containing protein 96 n=1 Tax=Amblyraja radiata TaxID=386614 RepID=UPI001402EC5A|nr:coiled-coil domain-containing protein 96 [Amblyraja radiata]